jgi:hypothetical protein
MQYIKSQQSGVSYQGPVKVTKDLEKLGENREIFPSENRVSLSNTKEDRALFVYYFSNGLNVRRCMLGYPSIYNFIPSREI